MLKHHSAPDNPLNLRQPPSGGCVLKQHYVQMQLYMLGQPPSGGCVLKPIHAILNECWRLSAAFGRLRVETSFSDSFALITRQPPSGGCVLKHLEELVQQVEHRQPPSGGCVLKLYPPSSLWLTRWSAAFGRLRVETTACCRLLILTDQPPSGGCVLKQGRQLLRHLRELSAAFGRLRVETI